MAMDMEPWSLETTMPMPQCRCRCHWEECWNCNGGKLHSILNVGFDIVHALSVKEVCKQGTRIWHKARASSVIGRHGVNREYKNKKKVRNMR